MQRLCLLLALAGLAFSATAISAQPSAANAKTWRVYVGTYTGKKSKGIYLFELDAATGKLTDKGLAGEANSPSFLAIHPSGKYLFAVSEVGTFDGMKSGAVLSFSIDEKTGLLKAINGSGSGGSGPCHLVTDKTGKFVLVANYGGGSVSSIPIGDDGKLDKAVSTIQHKGVGVSQRQAGPNAHSINIDPTNKFAMAADLGLDKVFVYAFDPAKGTLSPTKAAGVVAPGSGPRHFAFHPDGKHAFVINEMLLTLTSFKYDDKTGKLTECETWSTIPKTVTDRKGMSTAEVVVHPSGKFVYGSNRGHNSIAIFKFDSAKSELTPIGHVSDNIKTPRNFTIDPSGTYLLAANQSGDSITVFRINQETGLLTQVGEPTAVPSPVCLRLIAVK